MRIIHIIDTLDPATGGPANVAPCLAAAQAALGHSVTILCNNPKNARLSIEKHLSRIPHIELVEIADLKAPRTAERLLPINAFRWLTKELDEGAVAHLHGIWEPTLWIAAAIARRKGAVYAVRPCSMLHPWQMKRYPNIKKIVFAIGVGSMLKKASFIQALNEDEARFVKAYTGNAPIEIVPNGIFPEHLPDARLDHPLPELDGKRFILFLARLHYQKGIKCLAKAFGRVSKQVEEVYLVMAGPDGGDKKAFIEELKQQGCYEKTIFTGPIYGEEKKKYLSNAYCFCQPSLNEGFSNSIVEALAYGLPVITTKFAFFPEIETANAGYVTELDDKEIANRLIEILNDPNKRNQMSTNGKTLITNNYTWNNIAENLVNAYQRAKTLNTAQRHE